MKSEIYNAIAALSRGFDMALESLKILHEQGVISEEFASDNSVRINNLWADINYMVMHKRTGHELEDREHFAKMLETIEKRLHGAES
jgi:hypothetical protein